MNYTQYANPNASNGEQDAKQIITKGGQMARMLRLTNDQFDVLYDILADTVDVIEGDLIEYEDDNGQLQLEDITEYEAYKIFQQLKNIRGKS
jgi:hypothetical protein